MGGSGGDDDEDDGGGSVEFGSEIGYSIILPLRPQAYGRAQRRVTPADGTPSFPRATTMTTSARGGALHITMLSEGVVVDVEGRCRRDGVVDEVMER